MTARKKTASFESGLERLEQIAVQMETSDIPLDDLMALYEEGMKLLSSDSETESETFTDITEEMT